MSPNLSDLRHSFESIDREILSLLAQRAGLARQMAAVKANKGLPVVQLERWKQQLARRQREGLAWCLSARFTAGVFNQIHRESVRLQKLEIKRLHGKKS